MEVSNNFPEEYIHKKFNRRKRYYSEIDSLNSLSSSSSTINDENINSSSSTINDENINSFPTDGHISMRAINNVNRLSADDETISISSTEEICNVNSNQHTSQTPKKRKIGHTIKEEDAINLLQMPQETLFNICKYHPNMARHTIKRQRTPKDQERRNKNTIACRKTRRVKKLQEIAQQEAYKKNYDQYIEILREQIRARLYIGELIKLVDEQAKLQSDKSETSEMTSL